MAAPHLQDPTRKVMMYMSPRTKMTAGKTSVEALVDVMSVDGGPT